MKKIKHKDNDESDLNILVPGSNSTQSPTNTNMESSKRMLYREAK